MSEKRIRNRPRNEIAEAIAKSLGLKFSTTQSVLSKALNGKTPLPSKWEQPIAKCLEVPERELREVLRSECPLVLFKTPDDPITPAVVFEVRSAQCEQKLNVDIMTTLSEMVSALQYMANTGGIRLVVSWNTSTTSSHVVIAMGKVGTDLTTEQEDEIARMFTKISNAVNQGGTLFKYARN